VAARIFISYSKKDPQPTRDLAAYLTSEGYSVWWDTDLTAGEDFRDVIDRELEAADAVIVIWTGHSIESKWVKAEADHADRDGKLIPLRARGIDTWSIPKPFGTYQTDFVDDCAAVLKAVRRIVGRGVEIEDSRPIKTQIPKTSEAWATPRRQGRNTDGETAKYQTKEETQRQTPVRHVEVSQRKAGVSRDARSPDELLGGVSLLFFCLGVLPPVIVGWALGAASHNIWHWHPVFAIFVGLITVAGSVCLLFFSASITFAEKQSTLGKIMLFVIPIFYYDALVFWISIPSIGLDIIWSVTISILYSIALFASWKYMHRCKGMGLQQALRL
jgi:hypothetical protein